MTLHAAPPTAFVEIDRKAIASMLMRLFDLWKLTNEEQLDVLGLPLSDLPTLAQYREGEPMAAYGDSLVRAGHLFSIHKKSRLLFPHDETAAYGWIKTPNSDFEKLSPMEVIGQHGISGLLMVSAYLDKACAQ